MSFVIVAPEFVSAAGRIWRISVRRSARPTRGAVPDDGVLAAGADEVSVTVTSLFDAHAGVSGAGAEAAAFHPEFVKPSKRARQYAAAEAANASPLQTVAQDVQGLAVFGWGRC